ncbi:endonuclease domain-containing protein [Crossiella sp. CA198]|uniref:endonuclease domain-containing protein n=1 Tax=Crossiella sp. CA198 TaxID=3455607 RepID=UPI003F8D6C1D
MKPAAAFPRDATRPGGRHPHCSTCRRAYRAGQRDAARDRRYRSRYGLTADQVDQVRADQHYRCAVCGRHEDQLPHGLVVDHDHVSGLVRGLLCSTCNALLGLARDSAAVLAAAQHYLHRAAEAAATVDTDNRGTG